MKCIKLYTLNVCEALAFIEYGYRKNGENMIYYQIVWDKHNYFKKEDRFNGAY